MAWPRASHTLIGKLRKGTTMIRTLACAAVCVLIGLCQSAVLAKPLKIYILAGQSNMEGHAQVSTFDYIGRDPKTAPLLKEMRGEDGNPKVCDNVWISYFTGWETFGMAEVVPGQPMIAIVIEDEDLRLQAGVLDCRAKVFVDKRELLLRRHHETRFIVSILRFVLGCHGPNRQSKAIHLSQVRNEVIGVRRVELRGQMAAHPRLVGLHPRWRGPRSRHQFYFRIEGDDSLQ